MPLNLFQSTHLREVRPHIVTGICSRWRFQSTHLREVRLQHYVHWLHYWGFNPRTYVRCDCLSTAVLSDLISFNPRTYVRCDPYLHYHCKSYQQFQSTHLREVRPCWYALSSYRPSFNPRTYVRCDSLLDRLLLSVNGFNPRTYVRCDLIWGSLLLYFACFNPRTYVRCDFSSTSFAFVLYCFNPRTYVRCDSDVGVIMAAIISFNPRTYVRCDLSAFSSPIRILMFQSTHLREVRRRETVPVKLSSLFQSTHLREVRLCNIVYDEEGTNSFNPRTYVRCDCTYYNHLIPIHKRLYFCEHLMVQNRNKIYWRRKFVINL